MNPSLQTSRKRRHKVDLAGLQALCAANYARLLRLFPRLRASDSGEIAIDLLGECNVHVKVLERGPYTTIIDIEQRGGALAVAPSPQFQVRIYHDARMAEVVACHGHRRIQPRYDYPNKDMYQRDEKFQVNRFFGEWLGLCQATGRQVEGTDALLDQG